MVMTLKSILAEQEQTERHDEDSRRAAVLISATLAISQAISLADHAQERLIEADEVITAVRTQRDATLDLLKRYEAERLSYRVQGYAFGFILGVAVTYAVLS